MSKVTFGEVLKTSKQSLKIKTAPVRHLKSQQTTDISFKDILKSINKVKSQSRYLHFNEFTNFIPTVRHPPNLSHLQEVISEGQKSNESLWDSKRQFEWVNERSNSSHPRMIENGSFFWSQKGIKIPWYEIVNLAIDPIKNGIHTLNWNGEEIESSFSGGVFHVKAHEYKFQSVDLIIGDDVSTLRELQSAKRNGLNAVFKTKEGVVIYIK